MNRLKRRHELPFFRIRSACFCASDTAVVVQWVQIGRYKSGCGRMSEDTRLATRSYIRLYFCQLMCITYTWYVDMFVCYVYTVHTKSSQVLRT